MRFCHLIYVLLVSITLVSCKCNVSETNRLPAVTMVDSIGFLYNIDDPIELQLDRDLEEISGLAFSIKENLIYTHNDEEGIIFLLNADNGEIVEKIPFGKDGDYEGIALVDRKVVVVNSSGNLSFYDLHSEDTDIIKTDFKNRNNIEGLAYDVDNNQLLLASKGIPLDSDKTDEIKAIYSFDLGAMQLIKSPYLEITSTDLLEQFDKQYTKAGLTEKEIHKLENRLEVFAPSAVEIHPETKDLYILSARGEVLIIFDSNKKIKNIVFLDKKLMPQPEGITFDNAYMYIGTEMKNKGGKIFKFRLSK